MEQNVFSAMELDAIGEVMNISLGSSATAVSNLLDHRVDITTPQVSVVPVEEFTLGDLEPAIAIEIKYVSGLEGSNIMLLKRSDVKVIVDILMGSEVPEEEFELNDLTISAVCEVMNQMMGAASTALSDFLGRSVNISTPKSFTLDDMAQFKQDHFHTDDGLLVVARFMLGIENMLNSEFVNVMSVDLARELLGGFGIEFGALSDSGSAAASEASQPAAAASTPPAESAPATDSGGGKLSQEEIERLMGGFGGGASESPAPAPSAPAADTGGGKLSQDEIEKLMGGLGGDTGASAAPEPQQPAMQPQMMQQPAMQPQMMQQPAMQPQMAQQPMMQPQMMQQPMMQPQMAMQPQMMQQPMMQPQMAMQPVYQPEPKVISTRPMQLPALDVTKELGEERAQNLELIMSVSLEVSVEIGRTRRKVEEILTFSKGSLVVLDKLAGDQVDLFVNGLCVARGDVVVIDDNFGVRITEVLKQPDLMDLAQKS